MELLGLSMLKWKRTVCGKADKDLFKTISIMFIARLDTVGICPPSHLTDEYGTRPFLKWDRAQGRSPHAPGISKNASDPVGIPLKGAPQAPGDKPNPSEEGLSLGGGPLRQEVFPVKNWLAEIRGNNSYQILVLKKVCWTLKIREKNDC